MRIRPKEPPVENFRLLNSSDARGYWDCPLSMDLKPSSKPEERAVVAELCRHTFETGTSLRCRFSSRL